jgi:hypothetical protein
MSKSLAVKMNTQMIRDASYWISRLLSAKLGRCPKCMRLSLRGAVVGWFVSATIYFVGPHVVLGQYANPVWPLVLIWPLSFTGLWLLHILVFGARVVKWELGQHRDQWEKERELKTQQSPAPLLTAGASWVSEAAVVSASLTSRLPRRQMLGFFVRGAAFAVFVSSTLAGRASAASCDCDDKNSCCEKPTMTQCCYNAARGEWHCVPPGNTCCTSPYATWSCGGSTPNCSGDGQQAPYCY